MAFFLEEVYGYFCVLSSLIISAHIGRVHSSTTLVGKVRAIDNLSTMAYLIYDVLSTYVIDKTSVDYLNL
jgi:hypothetical protein